jgi:hypothetical protein
MEDERIPADVPFSLVCEQCDAGMEIGSFSEALAAGWTDVRPAPDLPSANYLGLCPDCRAEEEKRGEGSNEA